MLIPVSLATPAVRLELTVGDLGTLRRFPSARVWRPELDSNQRRRLRRPSTGPPAGANWSGRTESNRPVPRWQRCRAPCAPAYFGSCRRICTCCLRLIRSVLICMSFAALVRTAGLAPAASEFRARPSAADLRPENGHAGRSCTCVKSLCGRLPVAARPRRDVGVTGWACTSYGGVTARGLSTSPSAT